MNEGTSEPADLGPFRRAVNAEIAHRVATLRRAADLALLPGVAPWLQKVADGIEAHGFHVDSDRALDAAQDLLRGSR